VQTVGDLVKEPAWSSARDRVGPVPHDAHPGPPRCIAAEPSGGLRDRRGFRGRSANSWASPSNRHRLQAVGELSEEKPRRSNH
jgi:hypothetical protein